MYLMSSNIQTIKICPTDFQKKNKSKEISINLLQFLPRNYTITTNNSSAKFNDYLLFKTSVIIADLHRSNPNCFQFHLNINDEGNNLSKLERIYMGESIKFENSDFNNFKRIVECLQIYLEVCLTDNVPIYTRYKINLILDKNYFLGINKQVLNNIIMNEEKKITIKTKKSEYKCNYFGAFSSSIIREHLLQNPKIDRYDYDYDDEEGQFQFICDIFNFKMVTLTSDNFDIIDEIAKNLRIDSIISYLDDILNCVEKTSQSIDDQQKTIDMIDDLFDLLYHIKEKKVDFVSNEIKNSKWLKTEKDVYELASFIIQIIQNSIDLHDDLIDLLINLDNENNFKKLLPFVVNNLMLLLSEKSKINVYQNPFFTPNYQKKDLIYPFVYKLYHKGIISKDKLLKKLNNYPVNDPFLVSWFLPELMEINFKILPNEEYGNSINIWSDQYSKNLTINLIYPCNSKRIEEFKQMRDKGEINDEISKSLRNDDIDTFQSIISKNPSILQKGTIQQNIFEPFIISQISYLNYAAAYGSVKCFKYILLNDNKITDETFSMAVFGGNSEIIRIVDNELTFQSEIIKKKIIENTIIKHQNDLFDWIFETKFGQTNQNDCSSALFLSSIENCNIHSLIQIIDNKLYLKDHLKYFNQFFQICSAKGYYLLIDFLLNLVGQNSDEKISIQPLNTIYFDNIYIFKKFENLMNASDLNTAFLLSLKLGRINLIKYFFEKEQYSKFNFNQSIEIFRNCLYNDSEEVFNLVFDKVKDALNSVTIIDLFKLLKEAFSCSNIEGSKRISEIIYKNNSNNDFTEAFIQAASFNLIDVLKFYIDKKYKINQIELFENIFHIFTNERIYSFILDNIDTKFKEMIVDQIDQAIKNSNIQLTKYLLKEVKPSKNELIISVQNNNFQIFKMILDKNSEPSYINKKTEKGNALLEAVKNDRIKFVKKLLSIPGIDINISDELYRTPLICAVSQCKYEIFLLILDFYGDDVSKQKLQFELSMMHFINEYEKLSKLSKNNENANNPPSQINNDNFSKILIRIIELKYIDPNLRFKKHTLLTLACKLNLINVVESLLKCESIDVNLSIPETGNTPLITAIQYKRKQIIQLLINDPRTNINSKNYECNSALIIASILKQEKTVKLILNNEKFDPDESNINHAFSLSDSSISILLIPKMKDIDIGQINRAAEKNDVKMFNLIIKHPSFHKDKNQLIEALNIALTNNNYEIFKNILKLLKEFDIDINSPIFDNKTALYFALKKGLNFQIIQSILKNSSFDEKKNDFLNAFEFAYSNDLLNISSENGQITQFRFTKINILNLLYDYDCKHEHLIDTKIKEKGSSFLSSMYSTIFSSHNIDPNKSCKDFYPLNVAIINNSYILALCLINSNQVDMNKVIKFNSQNKTVINDIEHKMKETTYIHLAAIYGRTKILNEILSRNLIDINKELSSGNTPLLVACKAKQIDVIKQLFKYDNLDFSHRNKKGKDALDLVSKNIDSNKNNSKKITDKNTYLAELLRLMQLKKSSIDSTQKDDAKKNQLNVASKFNQPKNVTKTASESDNKITQNKESHFKFEFYNESFSEKPTLNFQDQKNSKQKNSSEFNKDDLNQQETKISLKSKKDIQIPDPLMSDDDDDDEFVQQPFVDQNQMMVLMQQQQQWLQMIQMNNAFQVQINMKMMNLLQNGSQVRDKYKKRKKKNHK